jgi:hypothetical protein
MYHVIQCWSKRYILLPLTCKGLTKISNTVYRKSLNIPTLQKHVHKWMIGRVTIIFSAEVSGTHCYHCPMKGKWIGEFQRISKRPQLRACNGLKKGRWSSYCVLQVHGAHFGRPADCTGLCTHQVLTNIRKQPIPSVENVTVLNWVNTK